MASVTLAESAKLTQNMLVQGVIENVVTVNRMYDLLPFDEIEGNAIAYNRENALGDVQTAAVGDTITAKNPATFTQVTSSLTTIIGDAEVNGLIEATRSNVTDQTAVQIASKAKSIGRKYADLMINGAGAGADITGLLGLVDASKKFAVATDGATLTLDHLNQLIDLVTSKDGEVDFIGMNATTIRGYYKLLQSLGGAHMEEIVTLPSGRTAPAYRGIPILRNDWIPSNLTQGAATASTSPVIAGVFDDGSRTLGIAGLTAMGDAGIRIRKGFVSETKDETINRVVFYAGLACFNANGLAVMTGIKAS